MSGSRYNITRRLSIHRAYESKNAASCLARILTDELQQLDSLKKMTLIAGDTEKVLSPLVLRL
jgi:hypothetical protein